MGLFFYSHYFIIPCSFDFWFINALGSIMVIGVIDFVANV